MSPLGEDVREIFPLVFVTKKIYRWYKYNRGTYGLGGGGCFSYQSLMVPTMAHHARIFIRIEIIWIAKEIVIADRKHFHISVLCEK